jgi:hypothetical protein
VQAARLRSGTVTGSVRPGKTGRMETLAAPGFEAEDEPVRSRLEALKHAVGDTIAPLDVRVGGDASAICDSIRSAEAGAARVLAVRLSPGEALRPRLIRRSAPDLCKIDDAQRLATTSIAHSPPWRSVPPVRPDPGPPPSRSGLHSRNIDPL